MGSQSKSNQYCCNWYEMNEDPSYVWDSWLEQLYVESCTNRYILIPPVDLHAEANVRKRVATPFSD